MKKILIPLSASPLLLIYSYAAFSKLVSFGLFQYEMHNQPFPRWFADVLIFLLPLVELCICLSLIIPRFRISGFFSSVVLSTGFCVYTVFILAGAFHRVPCSCGGVISSLGWKGHFWLNLFMILLSITGYLISKKESFQPIHR